VKTLEIFTGTKQGRSQVFGFALILHGYSRTTGDMDIWMDRTPENYQRIKKAFFAIWDAGICYDRREFSVTC
jgi:hypothetical protein